MNRRSFVVTAGLASLAGLAAGKLVLAGGAKPTPQSGDAEDYVDFLNRKGGVALAAAAAPAATSLVLPRSVQPTEPNIIGPYYRPGAPTRYTILSPYEPGTVMLIRGRVWGYDTKAPIANAPIHVWQANDQGRYENDPDPENPPAEFVNRGIIFTDAQGAYEYLTIHPGRYLNGNQYRPSHVHYLLDVPGYRKLITQLYFKGDPYNGIDPFIRKSLIIDLQSEQRYGKTFESGVFDIVLRP
jgi:catechol 1,2-dioxygenase